MPVVKTKEHEFKIEIAEEEKKTKKVTFEVEQGDVKQHKRRPEKSSISSTTQDANGEEEKRNCLIQ